jgi:NAD(P)-dependent dehydrogenase (short-subunit alcohol dehydrogenase family)
LDVEQLGGRIAVVTGGGSGIGRELVCQLAASGCQVATCDVSTEAMDETRTLALQTARPGTAVLTFQADVADEQQIVLFRDAVTSQFTTSHINLLFNNAGISGGGSFVTGDRKEWDQTFAVDWGGIYLSTRVFLPMLMSADEGHLINVSSINGLWASVGPSTPHTAYSTAKFAVRGFTEALITDFRLNAPHLRASVVMPGHIGTSIIINSNKAHGVDPDAMDSTQLSKLRDQLVGSGMPVADLSDDDLRSGIRMIGEVFRDGAPTSAAQAATIILDGVRNNRWRILVGEDAEALDVQVRAAPDRVYDRAFWNDLRERGLFGMFPG